MLWPPMKGGEGVQVSTVFPALQTGVTVGNPVTVVSKNVASVRSGSIAALKVKTTAAEGETPVAPRAGTTSEMITWACAWVRQPRARIARNRRSKREF